MRAVLTVLGTGAVILLAATVPNALMALKPFIQKRRGKVNERSLERVIQRLKGRRMVEFVTHNRKTVLQITESGRKRLREFEFEQMKLALPKPWDGKWTIILFDIPEYKKTARDALRRKLQQLGCCQYHRSVFVHPSDCADEVDFIAELFNVERHVIHFRTPSLGNQEYRVRKFFRALT